MNQTNPYSILEICKLEPYLASFFEETQIIVKLTGEWLIKGHGMRGEGYITLTKYGCLRLELPISDINPKNNVSSLLATFESTSEGILRISQSEDYLTVYYIVHLALANFEVNFTYLVSEINSLADKLNNIEEISNIFNKGLEEYSEEQQDVPTGSIWDIFSPADEDKTEEEDQDDEE